MSETNGAVGDGQAAVQTAYILPHLLLTCGSVLTLTPLVHHACYLNILSYTLSSASPKVQGSSHWKSYPPCLQQLVAHTGFLLKCMDQDPTL